MNILGKETKSKYNVFSNIRFMLEQAREVSSSVIWLVILIPILNVALQTTHLLFTPAILEIIEGQGSLYDLLLLIFKFTTLILIINGLNAYMKENTLYGRIDVRSKIVSKLSQKQGTTSYPNIFESSFQKTFDRAKKAVSSNAEPGEAIWETLSLIIEGLLGSIIYLFLMSKLDTWIILLTIATTVLSFVFSRSINEWGYRNRDEVADISKEMMYLIEKSSNHIDGKDIRIFNMKPWLNEVYAKSFKLYKNFNYKSQFIYFGADLIDLVLTLLRNGIAYTYLVRQTINGDWNSATFVLLFTAINGLTDWINNLLKNFTILYRESLEISVVRELLDFKEPFRFEEGLDIKPDPQGEYSIEFKNVSFRYPGAKSDTLKDINLVVEPREKLAIVGLNGAGKTTLVKLITGLYDPSEGEILLNGNPIRDFNRRDIYKHFSAVFQEFSVMAGSIYENIGQDEEKNIDINFADLAIERAGLSERISRFPQGGYTKLIKDVYEDSVELSGGELQRLMLARALYKDGPILILDEPTAALDPIAENNIYLHYNEMTKEKTSIFISHRLASTRFCDRIIFIGDGKILEEGSHDELIERNGLYADLFNIQSHYYREEGGILSEG